MLEAIFIIGLKREFKNVTHNNSFFGEKCLLSDIPISMRLISCLEAFWFAEATFPYKFAEVNKTIIRNFAQLPVNIFILFLFL
jgi:hypothetical protein